MVEPDPANGTSDDEFSTRYADPGDDAAPVDEFATVGPVSDSAPVGQIRFDAMVRGDHVGGFRIQRLLGRGSFGSVYLARELKLDRLVALKVVLPQGQAASAGEGKSLARLKHPNIVGVFGETLNSESGCTLLWMQFIDGWNLANLIDRLHTNRHEKTWCENDLLRLIVASSSDLEPEGERIGSVECVCRIGARIAEAIDHAHQSGIIHRDIKPANILMASDGEPSLADFNLAEPCDATEHGSGGTIVYMAPEQLAQFLGAGDGTDVGPRSDLYSLGVVLWELACGRRPHQDAEQAVKESGGGQRLAAYLKIRCQDHPADESLMPLGLAMVLRRAMMADPKDRFPSAAAMATALRGLQELQRARRRAPMIVGSLDFIRRNLFGVILVGGLLPHFAASIMQSSYNATWIVEANDPDTAAAASMAFVKAFIAYNIVVYPICIGWLAWNLYRFRSGYRRVVKRVPLARGQLRRLRGRLLKLPRQFMIASAVGWFPGTMLYPLLLGWFAGSPLPARDWFHYFISFAVAGMIATTYSYLIVLSIVIGHGYRSCWQTAAHYRDRARYELRGFVGRIAWLSILAGILPLAAATLLLAIEMPAAEELPGDRAVLLLQLRRLDQLLIALIVSGAIGLYVVERASARMIRSVRALTLADG